MKLTIGYRLFLAIAASMTVLAGIGLGVVRWRLFADPTGPHAIESADALAAYLAAQHALHRDWSFLPAEPGARKAWLRDEWNRVADPAATAVPMQDRRIGLLDQDGHYLAGVVASRFLIAFASIDTVRHAIGHDGRTVGYLVLATPQGADDALTVAFLLDQQANLALTAFAAIGLGMLVAALLAAHVRRPIRRLVEATRAIERGQLDRRVSLRRSDELGELAAAFDHLAAKLADAEASRRQWVADTSHELRTPLAVLQGQLEALQDGVRAPTADNLALMLRNVRTLDGLVDTLYQLARADVGRMEFDLRACDAWQIASESMQACTDRFVAAGLEAGSIVAPARTIVEGDTERLRSVFANLFENASRYTDRGGRVELSGAVVDGHLHVSVDDSPPGVPAALLARLGERFFRVDPSRSRRSGGSGLGLALARAIVEAHRGHLAFAASPLGGLRATIVLPLASP